MKSGIPLAVVAVVVQLCCASCFSGSCEMEMVASCYVHYATERREGGIPFELLVLLVVAALCKKQRKNAPLGCVRACSFRLNSERGAQRNIYN